MAVGAEDYIDKLLVKKYATQKVENHDDIVNKMVDPQKMMDAMNDVAAVQRSLFTLSNKLTSVCSQINAKARYKTSPVRQTYY